MRQTLTIAQKEFLDGIRNRWGISITLIFAILSVGITYFGGVSAGVEGITSLSTIIASLASLAVFLIPLIALLLSYDSFVGEQEAGTLLLLLTYPMSKTQLLLGKFIGQGLIISLATFLGFGVSAVILYFNIGEVEVIITFATFILSAILFGLSFIAIAYIISLAVNEKSKAAGIALVTWFAFVLVFDLALLALLVGTENLVSQDLLTQIMLLNPADIFRLVNIAGLDSSDINGALSVAVNSNFSQFHLFSISLLWVIFPLLIAVFIFRKKSL